MSETSWIASGRSRRAPSKARSDSRLCGGMRSAAIPSILPLGSSRQYGPFGAVVHMISTARYLLPEPVSLVEVLPLARRQAARSKLSHLRRDIRVYEARGWSEEREAPVP